MRRAWWLGCVLLTSGCAGLDDYYDEPAPHPYPGAYVQPLPPAPAVVATPSVSGFTPSGSIPPPPPPPSQTREPELSR